MLELRVILGVLLAFCLGALTRVLRLPVPAPPSLLGALLVATVTAGYLAAGWIERRLPHPPSSPTPPHPSPARPPAVYPGEYRAVR